ncbi:MAG TPA: ABC transporter ATP-binding protein [Bacteroidia bacterium]|jgi:phospholipid/cholesterol/gamma-HCH transport system ATP-binding protein|nr:ABC transporter ATP-binding protein [Bacteroidia bacterium]
MIEVRNLSKNFGEKQVLKDFSFRFEQGKPNLIIGESGTGKSVLLKCMVGLLELDAGEVLYDGVDFLRMNFKEKKHIRREIGMLFQGGALFDSMTVEENVVFPLSLFTDKSEAEKKDRANSCLQRVNLVNINKLYPSEISGGMKKRVAIARAISMEPKYLFCDEPNSGLDPKTSILIDELINDLTHELNITTVVITHDMNSVLEIGDNIAFLYKGEKCWEGNKTEILHTDNKTLNDFVYATKFLKNFKDKLGK